ncbi:hypothetical protein LI328DRAFT_170225 [Trichoderma asperelloides]|nr:hypothetical protein LI328DRAFT_170225 [Trichoderma asperelloides]
MEGGAMSAKYTQVDGTGNHIKVLDAQSTLVEWAFPAISAAMPSHPCSLFTASLAHVSATTPRMGAPGASRPLARSEKGLNKKPSHEASVPGRRDSAHTPPRDSHWPRTSRAHQGIEAVAAAASSLRPPPALHLVRHAGSPEACEPQEASSTATLGRRCSLPRRAEVCESHPSEMQCDARW